MPRAASPTAFRSPAQFRRWLAGHHADTPELLIRCYRTGSAAKGMTYSKALDEALCFGWIDGVRRRFDENSFSVRFTPRKARSTWSRVNLARVEAVTAAGRMAPPGLAVVQARDESRTGVYSFERATASLRPSYEKRFRARKQAWGYFQAQAPWYRRTTVFWIMSAKRPETQLRRLDTRITCSAEARPIPPAIRDQPRQKVPAAAGRGRTIGKQQ
jgi:uncharacterized protein YdeI (YjbR/CyaY-like superfamily)